MKVSDVMTTEVVTVTPDTPLKKAAALMLDLGIAGVPVLLGPVPRLLDGLVRPGVGSNAYQPMSSPSQTSGQAWASWLVTW